MPRRHALAAPAAAALLTAGRQDRGPTLLPPSPANCPPGLGCSPIEVRFTAISPGTALVRAGRTTCGEALRCTGNRGRFAVTVRVDI